MGFSKLIFLGVNSILFLVVSVLATKVQGLNTFNVRKFGAKGYGKTEDTQGIMKAWKKACASTSPSTVVIPKGKYNVGPLMFLGPCKASTISINLRGILQAPRDLDKHKSQDGWIVFQYINGLTVFGGGTFDGQGSVAWAVNDCAKTGKCSSLPISLRLNGITNSTFKDITSLDSKLFHLNLIGCKNLTLKKITISAPDHSLNTDGIHIGRSLGINIFDSVIKTGDDCISLGDGSQKINIERVKCGPGHGISIGSLGKYNNEEPVKGVTVRNCTLSDTMNGVRIKTWPASPYGVASDLHFEDIVMNNVGTPILIDQKYCPYNKCQANIPSRVKLSNVSFKKIRGTSSTQTAVKLVCSRELPCQNVEIGDINLRYRGKDGSFATSECTNVKPRITGKLYPPACARMISS